MIVRIIRRSVVHGIDFRNGDNIEVEQFTGGSPEIINTAMATAKKKSKKNRNWYYGTEVWHEHLQSWISRHMYYNGYPILSR
jgi:hypothetical protein